jgi:hypothetical protein
MTMYDCTNTLCPHPCNCHIPVSLHRLVSPSVGSVRVLVRRPEISWNRAYTYIVYAAACIRCSRSEISSSLAAPSLLRWMRADGPYSKVSKSLARLQSIKSKRGWKIRRDKTVLASRANGLLVAYRFSFGKRSALT